MASRTRKAPATDVPEPVSVTETPTNSFSPSEGGNAIAMAWRGLYNLFDARFDNVAIDSDGFTFEGLTVGDSYDLDTIINDVTRRGEKILNPTLNFNEVYPLLMAETPAPFTDAKQITAWMVRHMKGGSRSPKYAKDANQTYKEAHGFAIPRGRPRKIFHIKDIASLDEAALKDVSPEEVEKLRHTLDSLAASQAAALVEA